MLRVSRTARDYLRRVVAHYRGLPQYQDEGLVRPLARNGIPSLWFRTDFASPKKIRFSFVRPHPFRPLHDVRTAYQIGSDGAAVYSRVKFDGRDPKLAIEDDLAKVVAEFNGVSQGTSGAIGRLLIPGVSGISIENYGRPRFCQVRTFEGVVCVTISAVHLKFGKVVLWIGAKDMLIRRAVWHRSRHQVVYRPTLPGESLTSTDFSLPGPHDTGEQMGEKAAQLFGRYLLNRSGRLATRRRKRQR